MSSNVELVKYVAEQIAEVGEVTYRKMFGEYMIYINAKTVLLICDDIVFIRKWENIEELCRDCATGVPYHNAKEHYVLDPDDKDFLIKVVTEAEKVAQVPKKKL